MRRILLLAAVAGTLAALAAPAVAQAPAGKPDLERAQKTASEVCLACHGPNGNSVKSGLRTNPIMQGIASTLTPEDMKAIGIYYSQQKPKGQAAKDAALVAAGQKLFRGGDTVTGVPACSACHSPNGAGLAKNYPRLAGQHADYTYAQLKAFKGGERGADKDGKDANGAIMATVSSRMTEAQMKAVAEYASGLR